MSSETRPLDPQICLGVITGASGVQGEVRIKPYTVEPKAIGAYGKVTTKAGDKYSLSNIKPSKGGVSAKLYGVDDRDAALALKGTELFVDRERLPEIEEEEFYYVDLIGLAAKTVDGETIGTVKAVHDFGAGDLLEIVFEDADSKNTKTEYVPFTTEVVPEVHVKDGYLLLVLPEEDEAEDAKESLK
jgi:16S rRNA processing protein RimM